MKIICEIKPYIQPFERKLALLELSRFTGSTPQALTSRGREDMTFEIETEKTPAEIASVVAYWERITGSSEMLTLQVLREATVNVVRNGVPLEKVRQTVPFAQDADIPIPNRRCLRYGTHGIHEYRGKFFPQLVRSLINISGAGRGSVVADPMCGSGTTPAEAVLAGCHGLGLDLNPLSVLMSRAKCAVLMSDPAELSDWYERVRSALLDKAGDQQNSQLTYFKHLPRADQKYLASWFAEEVLRDLNAIALEIEKVYPLAIRELMLLVLSNILRSVSWQKDADLRVRKDVRLDVEIDPIREFLEELGRSVRTVLAFLCQNDRATLGTFDVRAGSAREAKNFWRDHIGCVDVVITSPPYATALPYLDTDRLSLSYLGLLSRPEQRKRDTVMIGNREVNKKRREAYWDRFQCQKTAFPSSVVQLIERIYKLNFDAEVGFRRQNLPALLAKYFFDMREVLAQIQQMLKPGAQAYVVVGNNHTVAGGIRIDIETTSLLAEIGEAIGLTPGEHIPMEILASRDIFKKNAIASENILVLTNTG